VWTRDVTDGMSAVLLTHSLTNLLTYSLTHLLTHLLTHSLTYLLTCLLTHSRSRRSFDYGEDYDHHRGVTRKLGYQYENYDYTHVPTMSELYKDRMIMDSRMAFSGFVKKEVKEVDLLALWAEENKAKEEGKNEVMLYLLTYSLTHLLIYSLTYSPTHLLTHLLTHSLTHSPPHSLTHLLTYSLAYSLAYSLTNSQ
jgi:hypothetical protein